MLFRLRHSPPLCRFPQRDNADEIGHGRAEIKGERHIVFEYEVVDRPAEHREDNDDFELHLVPAVEKPCVGAGGRRGQQTEPAVGVEGKEQRELHGDECDLPRHRELLFHAEEIARDADNVGRDAGKRAENGVRDAQRDVLEALRGEDLFFRFQKADQHHDGRADERNDVAEKYRIHPKSSEEMPPFCSWQDGGMGYALKIERPETYSPRTEAM